MHILQSSENLYLYDVYKCIDDLVADAKAFNVENYVITLKGNLPEQFKKMNEARGMMQNQKETYQIILNDPLALDEKYLVKRKDNGQRFKIISDPKPFNGSHQVTLVVEEVV
jgi:hypothetical protein